MDCVTSSAWCGFALLVTAANALFGVIAVVHLRVMRVPTLLTRQRESTLPDQCGPKRNFRIEPLDLHRAVFKAHLYVLESAQHVKSLYMLYLFTGSAAQRTVCRVVWLESYVVGKQSQKARHRCEAA